jgi:type IV secretory pathway VirB4 component
MTRSGPTTLVLILKRTEANRTLTRPLLVVLSRQNFLPHAHDPHRGRCAPVWAQIRLRVSLHSDRRIFGIRDEDRLLHVYVIGKAGTGKSTLLENMALQDLERGHGFALIDPHGDLVRRIQTCGWRNC